MKKSTSPTFLLELPLQVNSQQAKHLQGHFEVARNLYNALLGEAFKRLNTMRGDSRYGVARTFPKGTERNTLFTLLRKECGFSEYALHAMRVRYGCHGLESISTSIPPKHSQPEPTKRSIKCASKKPRK